MKRAAGLFGAAARFTGYNPFFVPAPGSAKGSTRGYYRVAAPQLRNASIFILSFVFRRELRLGL